VLNPDWKQQLRAVHARGIAAWRSGERSPDRMWNPEDTGFLASIGCTPRELFDFVEDLCCDGEPDLATVISVQEIRKKHFEEVLHGKPAPRRARMEDLPPKSEAVDGISWLPRLIVKARLKLQGAMPDDLMYGCAGDRPFLRRMNSSLPEFLQLVCDHGEDTQAIVQSFKKTAGLS
jgi:hypothetical protein